MSQFLYNEALRPQFHFTAKEGWLNDPNGLVYSNGEYHLFFQHNPKGTEWGNMTWGHAVSPDLVHWKQIENAIEPDDRGTIFSGSAVTDPRDTSGLKADIVAIFTAAGGTNPESKGQPFTQRVAYSRDKGRTFTKLPDPIIPHIAGENRDPKVVWHEPSRRWVMALYLDGETYALFTSPDLTHWTERQRLNMPSCGECPDFFEIPVTGSKDRKWVFTAANGKYFVGDFDGSTFKPMGSPQQVEYGPNCYAVQSYFGLKNRRVQIGWMKGGRYPGMPFNQQMTFPCELTLRKTDEGLRLYKYPIKEISSLHTDRSMLTFDAEVAAPGDRSWTLWARDQKIEYNSSTKTITCLGRSAPLAPEKGLIRLRVLLDVTSLEVFGNGGRVSLSGCFDTMPDPAELGPAYPESLKIRFEGSVPGATIKAQALGSAWR